MTTLASERWASPLEDELRGALSAEFTNGLGTQDLADLPNPLSKRCPKNQDPGSTLRCMARIANPIEIELECEFRGRHHQQSIAVSRQSQGAYRWKLSRDGRSTTALDYSAG